jgi:serine protease Do
MPSFPFASVVDDDLAAIAARLRRSTVEVHTGRGGRATGHGSGIVWDARGLIVTNAHVARTPAATVTFADGRAADARLVAHDPRRDLATLQVDAPPAGLVPATVGDANALRPGHVVLAHGHPLGHAHALSVGIVHATDGTPFGRQRGSVIAADIRLAPGNSGGPLANAAGEVVGVNSMIAGGLGIAIPSTTVTRFLAASRPRPRLGVSLRPVTVALRGRPRTIATGLLVLEVAAGSPAARAGVLPGDVLLGVDGTPFAGADDLLARLVDAGAAGGGTLRLDVGRAGRRTVVAVALSAPSNRPRRAA